MNCCSNCCIVATSILFLLVSLTTVIVPLVAFSHSMLKDKLFFNSSKFLSFLFIIAIFCVVTSVLGFLVFLRKYQWYRFLLPTISFVTLGLLIVFIAMCLGWQKPFLHGKSLWEKAAKGDAQAKKDVENYENVFDCCGYEGVYGNDTHRCTNTNVECQNGFVVYYNIQFIAFGVFEIAGAFFALIMAITSILACQPPESEYNKSEALPANLI